MPGRKVRQGESADFGVKCRKQHYCKTATATVRKSQHHLDQFILVAQNNQAASDAKRKVTLYSTLRRGIIPEWREKTQ